MGTKREYKFVRGELVRLSNYRIAFPFNRVVKASFTYVLTRDTRTGEIKRFTYRRLIGVVHKRQEWIKGQNHA